LCEKAGVRKLVVRKEERRLLIPAGVALRGHQNQTRTNFGGTRHLLRGSAEGIQDYDDRGIRG
jgi:hypothetical protein